jgi:glycosyltransferase involved in cell wall biosynthesis
MSLVETSVIIPCLNEERTVGTCVRKCHEAFRCHAINGEVVVVDNGSADDTARIAGEADARVVSHEIRGYGSALMRGITESRGNFIIMADGDNTYDFSDIPAFIRLLKDGADLVMGSRFRGTIEPGAMPWLHRYVGTPFLTAVLNLLYRTRISDINCGMRAFTKKTATALSLTCPGMEFAAEMLMKASALRLRIEEIPLHYCASIPERKPHVRTFRDGWRHLRFMLVSFPGYGVRRAGVK